MGVKTWQLKRLYQQHTATKGVVTPLANAEALYNFERTGVSLPQWKAKIRSGVNAATAMDVVKRDVKVGPVPRWHVDYTWFGPPDWAGIRTFDTRNDMLTTSVDIAILGTTFGHLAPETVAEAESRATSALYRQIRQFDHQFQGAVVVGEFGKTVRMIANRAQSLKRGVLSYVTKAASVRAKALSGRNLARQRNLRLKGVSTSLSQRYQSQIANAYLEAVFGWVPLIHDIREGAEALLRLREKFPRIRFRAMGAAEKLISTVPSSSDLGNFQKEITQIYRHKTIYYGAFQATRSSNDISSYCERAVALSGFDLRSFVPTLWELTPYSFLVDYFVNVGELLEAASTDTSLVAWLVKVSVARSLEIQHLTWVGPSAFYYSVYTNGERMNPAFSGQGGSVDRSIDVISRQPLAGVPQLVPRFKIAEVSGKQMLNMAALLLR